MQRRDGRTSAPLDYWVLAGALLLTVVVSWVAPRLDKEWLKQVKVRQALMSRTSVRPWSGRRESNPRS
ncbi:MAG TPA: hypothetical protein VFK56_02285 [Mycobacterium sp.]|nr:hypothetical protein [Mycobacterium sp.]